MADRWPVRQRKFLLFTFENKCSIIKTEQTFFKFGGEKRMTFPRFGIILVENNDEEGDSYET